LIAGSCTLAMAQASGGAAGSDTNPDRIGKGADQNPTGPAANPRLARRRPRLRAARRPQQRRPLRPA
jgi:hypothetical protein